MSTNTQPHPQLEGMPPADPAAASPRNWDGHDRSGTLPVRPLRRWLRDYIIEWRALKRFSPQARFPVVVAGDHAFRAGEVLDVRQIAPSRAALRSPERISR